MEPLPLPPLPTTITAAANHHHYSNAGPTSIPLNYSDSGESSPLSRDLNANSWGDQESLPQVPGGPRLRLMCSYGGHIVPRPHDKSLCYVGGDTRIIAVDRHSSLSDLSSRLSRTLLGGRPFTLKYQLPAEDLDSLISVTTDEDLENMADEYDRSSSRLRLFLFFPKPEATASMGALLDEAKSETWFVDALNGAGLLPRGLSDPASVDCLLDLHHNHQSNDPTTDHPSPPPETAAPAPATAAVENLNSNSNSFGSSSSSSSPSMANLAPIRVRVEEQFARLDVSCGNPMPQMVGMGGDQGAVISQRGCSDDEGVPVGFRKPPLPIQTLQQSKQAGFGGAGGGPGAAFSLPSPDSVTSDCSITSANSFSKPMLYQDNNNMAPASPNTTKTEVPDPTTPIRTQPQAQDPNYMLDQQQQQVPDTNYMITQQQQQQQQFVRYIPNPANSGAVPVSSYYQIYPQQQQYHQPLYVMPMSHTQSYNMSTMQQPDHTMASPGPATHPPVYPPKPAQPGMVNTTPLIQVPQTQFQQQFVGYAQAHHHNLAQQPGCGGTNYGYEYSHSHPDQVYYAQTQVAAAPLPPQYQTMTPAALAALTDAANQINTNAAQ